MQQFFTSTVLAAAALPALLWSGDAHAQDWIRQAPYPADVHLHAVHFLTPDVGFITGEDDLFMVTTDGGETWMQHEVLERHPFDSEDSFWHFEFLNDQEGWLVGNRIFHTTDGGAKWDELPGNGTTYDYRAVSDMIAYSVTNHGIYRTDNGGQSFSTVWSEDDFSYNEADFFGPNLGLVSWHDTFTVGGPEGVSRTTDGGQTWEQVRDSEFDVIRIVNENLVIAAHQGNFYRSIDGGVKWTMVHSDVDPVFGSNHMADICVIDDDSLAAIGSTARIWISHDEGATWTRTQDPIANWGSHWRIQFPTPEVGYAVGRLGIIFKSIDGGETWEQISNGVAVEPLRDIIMRPSGLGIAVGERVMLRTEDFGQHWRVLGRNNFTNVDEYEQMTLYSVEAISDDVIVAGGKQSFEPAPFLRSEDGGLTWTQLGQDDLGDHWEIYDLEFTDEDNGWLFGFWPTVSKDGVIMRTTDGGQSWTHLFPLGTIDRVPDGDVHTTGSAWALHRQPDVLRRSSNLFASSTTLSLPVLGHAWEALDFGSDTTGWIGDLFGELRRTTNGGASTTIQSLPNFIADGNSLLLDIHALSADEAYVAGHRAWQISYGFIYHTTNGGASWDELDHITDPNNQFGGEITDIEILPTGEIFTVGHEGYIYASGIPDFEVIGDVNGDGTLDADDRALFCAVIGSAAGERDYIAGADLNDDAVIDHLDLAMLNDILPPCDGDVVTSDTFEPPGDGMTDGADLAYLLGAWASEPSCADFVATGTFAPPPDGHVDGADLAYLLGAWGTCE